MRITLVARLGQVTVVGEFRIFLAWLTIRRQNDRLALPYRSRA
jgi:hypothetical protein